ncbi:cyclophilin-like fold protein [Catenisphaera adipataccumulans]|uniref:Cyclophilin-like domain-containing protein n=1 Tax=Catenisphaera adipataccumulans TaxID=700500 RepID=A0A7W8CZ66_9FIRM|nr:cyclophilin-like fold protein [Catenisphaera adipataccumulans]MBB5182645.1 hypothetical protein [Catenisphaera adipataccumulans]
MKQDKKWLILLIAMIVSFSLSACSGQNGTSSADQQKQKENTQTETNTNTSQEGDETMITLTINNTTLTAELADNSSAEALKNLLAEGPLTINMSDYANMEKVGDLGTSLPTNNKQITTKAGDLILYQGNQFVIYYAPNSWNFTRLGKIKDVSASELKEILGSGDVTVTIALAE